MYAWNAEQPRARTEGLICERVDGDLVIYDQASNMAHCLSPSAALVWGRCDGHASADAIASQLNLPNGTVEQAVQELHAAGLLVTESGYSRRAFAKRVAAVGGAAVAANALLYSVGVPTAAAACSSGRCLLPIPFRDWNQKQGQDPQFVFFSAIISINVSTPVHIALSGSTITYTDLTNAVHTIQVPDATIVTSSGAPSAGTVCFSTPGGHPNGLWSITAPTGNENIFLSGVTMTDAVAATVDGSKDITWNFPISGTPGTLISVQWRTQSFTGADPGYGCNGTGLNVLGASPSSASAGVPQYKSPDSNGWGSHGSLSSTQSCTITC